jgi:hypothetical protein
VNQTKKRAVESYHYLLLRWLAIKESPKMVLLIIGRYITNYCPANRELVIFFSAGPVLLIEVVCDDDVDINSKCISASYSTIIKSNAHLPLIFLKE